MISERQYNALIRHEPGLGGCLAILLVMAVLFALAVRHSILISRLNALESSPPHVCEPVKALDTPPPNDDWSPENDAAIQYESWVRVPRKCGVGQQTTGEGR